MINILKILFVGLIALCAGTWLNAAQLDYTVPETQRSFQDFGVTLLSFRIAETDNAKGDLLSADGSQTLGSYSFASFPGEPLLADAQFLRVTHYLTNKSYLFLTNASRTNLTYLGWSENFALVDADIDTTHRSWKDLAFFLTGPIDQFTTNDISNGSLPLNIYASYYMANDMSAFFAQSTGVPREIYFPIFVNRMIDVLLAKPSLVLSNDLTLPFNVNLDDYPVVNADTRFALVQRMTSNWNALSAANKVVLVQSFSIGDGRIANLLANPVAALFSQTPFTQWGLLYPAVERIATNQETYTPRRTAVLNALVNSYTSVPQLARNVGALQLLTKILNLGDGLFFNKADYLPLQEKLARFCIQFYIDAPYIVTSEPEYLAENFRSLIPSDAKFLTDYDDRRAARRLVVLQSNFTTESWFEISQILTDYSLLNEEALIRNVIGKTVTRIKNSFAEKLADRNNFLPIDGVMRDLVRLMKKKNIYDDNNWILPLLKLYNPQQPGETAAQTSLRRGQVYGMWQLQRVFMFDLFGGMAFGGMKYGSTQNYALVFQEFARSQPMLLDIAFLRNYGNVTAFDGVIAMNWFATENPQYFATTIFHEGAHAIESAFKAKTQWKTLQEYFFQKSYGDPNTAIVSYYSLFNSRENHAELFAAWHSNSAGWLRYAIERFKVGDRKLLSQFLVISLSTFDGINGMTNLKDRIRMVTIQPDGKTIGSPLPGSWLTETNGQLGTMTVGWYRFTFENKTVTVRFNRGQITQMITGGVTYK